jgi:hypothetical protein
METDLYYHVHKHFNSLDRYSFPFNKKEISRNGIYILFEAGETLNHFDRIVRVGSHTGNDRLIKRLGDHFLSENQRSSIFRKHIGRCLLTMNNDSYIDYWNLPFKKIIDKEKNQGLVNPEHEKQYENEISSYIRAKLSFCIIPNLTDKKYRSRLEEGLIATLAQSPQRTSSSEWLGNSHPDETISGSKLWNIEYTNGRKLREEELEDIIRRTNQSS